MEHSPSAPSNSGEAEPSTPVALLRGLVAFVHDPARLRGVRCKNHRPFEPKRTVEPRRYLQKRAGTTLVHDLQTAKFCKIRAEVERL